MDSGEFAAASRGLGVLGELGAVLGWAGWFGFCGDAEGGSHEARLLPRGNTLPLCAEGPSLGGLCACGFALAGPSSLQRCAYLEPACTSTSSLCNATHSAHSFECPSSKWSGLNL